MGGYMMSFLYMNYNRHIYNENQYAGLFTFRRKGVYLVATNKWLKLFTEGICNMRLFHDRKYVVMVE